MFDEVNAVVAAAIGGVIGGLVAVAALVAVVLVVRRGSRDLLGMVSGDGGHRINISKSAPAGWTQADTDRLMQESDMEKARRRVG